MESGSEGDELASDWEMLISRPAHPTKVALIEALQYLDQELSATEVAELFGGAELSGISYHLDSLAEIEILTQTRHRRVNGVVEKLYCLPEPE
jgi:DNA-binding transcriptional ArsR family regulator